MSPPRAAGYSTDLAFIHDAGFGFFAENAARELLARLRRAGHTSGLVVDLGCGSGILAAELTQAGYDVLGYDISPPMIELARRRAPRAEFITGSFLTARFPACVAVTSIGEVFSYLFDRRNHQRRVVALARKIHRALVPGGLLLFDVVTKGRVPPGGARSFQLTDDWACLYAAEVDAADRHITRRITSFRRDGEVYRRTDEVHDVRVADAAELRAGLIDAGFQVRTLRGYDAFRFPRGITGFLGRKPQRKAQSG
ncbi:MAG: class I SAM-dependent methyltransferase [Pirellulales bacterium]|nr:class I SAM-dependent methyltransferase [Pirellulales bacterium]